MITTTRPLNWLSRDGKIMFAGMATLQGAFGSYQTLLPLYIAALGASPSQIGLVLGVTGVIRLIALVPAGPLTDHVSHKRVIVGGQAVMAVALITYALCQSWWQIIPAGLIFALGTATFPSVLAKIASIADESINRARTFTTINTVAPATGLLLAPLIGGVVVDQLSLRMVFVFAAALTVAATLMLSRLSSSPDTTSNRVRESYRTTFGSDRLSYGA